MVGVEEPFSKAAGLSIFCCWWKHANFIIEILNLNEGTQASNHGFMDWHFFRQSFLDKLQQTWEEVFGFTCFCFQACKVLVWFGRICDHAEAQVCQSWSHFCLCIELLDSAEHGVDSLAWVDLLSFCSIIVSKVVKQRSSQVAGNPSGIQNVQAVSPHKGSAHPFNGKKWMAAPFLKESLLRWNKHIVLIFFS